MGLTLGVLLEFLEDCQKSSELDDKIVAVKITLEKVYSQNEWVWIAITSFNYDEESQSILLNTFMQSPDLEKKDGETFYNGLILLEKEGIPLNTPIQARLEEYFVLDNKGEPIFGESFSIGSIDEIYIDEDERVIMANFSTDDEGLHMLICRRLMGKV